MKTRALFLAVVVVCGFTAAVQAKLVACVGRQHHLRLGHLRQGQTTATPPSCSGFSSSSIRRGRSATSASAGRRSCAGATSPTSAKPPTPAPWPAKPDIVVIKLGTNDSKPQNWQYKADFVADYGNMIDAFRALPSRPEVWICKPVPAFAVNFSIRPEVIRDEILPLIEQIAREKGTPVIDLYTALLNSGNLFPDAIHPNRRRSRTDGPDDRAASAGRSVPSRFRL